MGIMGVKMLITVICDGGAYYNGEFIIAILFNREIKFSTNSFSSVGRASVLWAEGRGFETRIEYMVLSKIWKLLRQSYDVKR